MARYVTTIESPKSAAVAFDLLANFESVAEWDPGVATAERLDSGELRVGSAFLVDSVIGPRHIPLTYVIRELEPGRRVVLEAITEQFSSYDVMTFEDRPDGSAVTYDATLTLRGPFRPFDPLLRLAFLVIGRRAEDGLRRALADRDELIAEEAA